LHSLGAERTIKIRVGRAKNAGGMRKKRSDDEGPTETKGRGSTMVNTEEI